MPYFIRVPNEIEGLVIDILPSLPCTRSCILVPYSKRLQQAWVVALRSKVCRDYPGCNARRTVSTPSLPLLHLCLFGFHRKCYPQVGKHVDKTVLLPDQALQHSQRVNLHQRDNIYTEAEAEADAGTGRGPTFAVESVYVSLLFTCSNHKQIFQRNHLEFADSV